jgi:hypothetical protein
LLSERCAKAMKYNRIPIRLSEDQK